MSRFSAAVRVESPDIPAWVAATIGRIERYCDVSLVVVVEPPRTPWLLSAYMRLDRRFLGLGADPYASTEAGVTADWDLHACTPSEAVSLIESTDVDVVIDFCADEVAVLPPLGRLGTWYLRLALPGVISSLRGTQHRVFELEVVARRQKDGDLVLEGSVSALDPVSLARTIDPAYWKAPAMFERCVRRVVEGGGVPELQVTPLSPQRRTASVANRSVVGLTLAVCLRIARRRTRKLFWRDEWFLAARPAGQEGPLSNASFRRLPQATNGYRADPFLLEHSGKTYIFFEEFDYERGRGHLAVASLDDGGDLRDTVPCLMPAFHVSYPCVFEHAGVFYMVPETASAQSIQLYEATDFPTDWVFVKDLVPDVLAVDPTVFFDGRTWWLFAGVFEPGASADDDLFIWSADSLTGEWKPHPKNPVVSDVRCARPAGLLFEQGGDLIRPAQDGSRGYGSGMTLRRVLTLTPEEYVEETVGRIGPEWLPGAHATHSFNKTNAFEVTDGQGRRRRFAPTAWRRSN